MDQLLSLLKEFDIANFLPPMDQFSGTLRFWAAVIMLAGPLVMLGLGLWYYYKPPKEANHSVGFRTYLGMGSIAAWQFTQNLAGRIYMLLGGGLSAVMLVISFFFIWAAPTTAMTLALICVVLELGLALAAWLHIQKTVKSKFDADGKKIG